MAEEEKAEATAATVVTDEPTADDAQPPPLPPVDAAATQLQQQDDDEPLVERADADEQPTSDDGAAAYAPTNGDHAAIAGRRDVCRDFMKNICNRGSRCKYFHPAEQLDTQRQEEVNFCIDFQNKGCLRDSCRFVHAFREDADRFKASGEVTLNLARAIAAVTNKDTINGIPMCKEYQNGTCARGNRCRYWHINPREERERRAAGADRLGLPREQADARAADYHGYPAGPPDPYQHARYPPPPARPPYDYDGPFDGPPGKRHRYDDYHPHARAPPSPRYVGAVERENVELKKENDTLKRELARERERYEDLYTLFRQLQAQQAQPAGAFAAGTPAANAPVMPPQAVPAPGMAPPQADLVSLAHQIATSLNAPQPMHQSMPVMSRPAEVVSHWSTGGR